LNSSFIIKMPNCHNGSQSRGVLLMAAAQRGLELAEYTPLQVKQAVCGYGNAEKNKYR
jgi:crossover junction endodeoxyribonuclease RuvC